MLYARDLLRDAVLIRSSRNITVQHIHVYPLAMGDDKLDKGFTRSKSKSMTNDSVSA